MSPYRLHTYPSTQIGATGRTQTNDTEFKSSILGSHLVLLSLD